MSAGPPPLVPVAARPRRRLTALVTAIALAMAPVAPLPGAATASAQVVLPELGDSSQTLMTPVQEHKLGEQIVRQIRSGGGYLNDPEVNDYLNELGARLVAATKDTKQDFQFFAVPDPQINAFALPGGYIGVHTGLILLAQSESELASVLAHEISHVTQRHMTRMLASQQNALLLSLAGLALAVLAARSGGSSGSQAAGAAIAGTQALAIQSQLNFTRENEYEADRIGFSRLVASGYDPNAAAVFMGRLQRSSRFIEGNTPSYLRTHPVTYERVAEAQARAEGLPYKQVADSLDFHLVRALLRSYQGDARTVVEEFDHALAQKKYNSEIAARYGLIASLLREGNTARAKIELPKLEKIAPPNPMVEAIAGHVLMDSGDLKGAVARFESALARYPNKMQLVYDYPEALIKAGRPSDAAAFAERELRRFPGDGLLHQIAAKAYAGQNMALKQFEHQGEYYAWLGNLKLAIDQYERAARANDGDFYQISVVETRLRTLRQELNEQQRSGFAQSG